MKGGGAWDSRWVSSVPSLRGQRLSLGKGVGRGTGRRDVWEGVYGRGIRVAGERCREGG